MKTRQDKTRQDKTQNHQTKKRQKSPSQSGPKPAKKQYYFGGLKRLRISPEKEKEKLIIGADIRDSSGLLQTRPGESSDNTPPNDPIVSYMSLSDGRTISPGNTDRDLFPVADPGGRYD